MTSNTEGLTGLGHPLVGIDHVAIAVRDIEIARARFDRLGLPVSLDETLDSPPVRLLHYDAGNVEIQLVQPLGPGRVADFLDARGDALHHLCFGVTRIDQALASLGEPPDVRTWVGARGRLCCFLTDEPAGTVVELTEIGSPGMEP